jgi:hypothetical protein
VSEAYQYDRVAGRDKPATERPKRPWERITLGKKKSRA